MPKPIKKASQVAKDNPTSQKEIEAKLKEQQERMAKLAELNKQDFEVVETVLKFDKKDVKVILEEVKDVNVNKVAEEVLQWLEANVENYIDNHAKVFEIPIDNLDVQVDDENSVDMSETIKLQNLYRAIPEDEDVLDLDPEADIDEQIEVYESRLTDKQIKAIDELVACRAKLDETTVEVFEKMHSKEDLRAKLAKRMMYFYEMVGFQDGQPLIQEQKGLVEIVAFEYEAFSIGVRIRQSEVGLKSDDQSDKQIVKEYIIPEGFNCCIELSCKPNVRPTVMF